MSCGGKISTPYPHTRCCPTFVIHVHQKVRIREHFATVHRGGSVSEEDVAEARLADVRAEAGGVAGVTEAMLAAAAASGRDVNSVYTVMCILAARV